MVDVQAQSGNGPKLETRPQFPLLGLTQNWKRSCLTQKWNQSHSLVIHDYTDV